ncbi:pectate lyase-like adhesive domain-containing protein [Limosilactobacillus reuteri]|uniref:pectate lyase-like adhesive domain-containing protein n=1 Tax=Limosilactobacillus reuteri TaxID=1598 RepID=UPI001CDCD0E4|nr:pectate lyase-like adhesive domain-containing protein [Limosilactobacillus reuteri]
MLSKNNRKEQFRKQEPKKQRFAIKKLTVGVASVLIGFTFMGMNASADTTAGANNGIQPAETNQREKAGAPTTTSAASETGANKTETEPSQASHVSDEYVKQVEKNDTNVNSQAGAANDSAPTPASDQGVQPVLASRATLTNSQGQTLDVSDWNSFGAALINPNVGNIVLTNDITANGNVANAIKDNYGELDVTAKDIARQVTIDGQGKYALNFGTNFLAFTNANQGDNNSAWDLTLKDLTVNGDGYQRTMYNGGYGIFYFGNVNATNGQKDTITLDGVTANIKQGPFIAGDKHQIAGHSAVINVVLKGNNTINNNGVNANNGLLVNYGSTIQTGKLTVESGTTTMNVGTYKTDNGTNSGGNMIEADMGDVTINDGATLNLNAVALDKDATATDVRGIWTNDDPANTSQYGLNGTVTINGNLNANMSNGHSSAIVTGNVTIGKTGVVNIKTKQDNNGVASGTNGVANFNGYHYAPISIAVGNVGNIASHDASLINEGSLTIIRDTTDASGTILPAAEPLIAFGSGGANDDTYIFKVGDGATLDLQDNAAVPSGWESIGLNNPKISKAGLITLFGTSNEAVLDITNPYYLNFQRVGNDTVGNFIRLEGTVNGAYLNYKGVQVNSDKDKILGTATDLYNTPIAQWEQGNNTDAPSFVWYLQNLMTTNGGIMRMPLPLVPLNQQQSKVLIS